MWNEVVFDINLNMRYKKNSNLFDRIKLNKKNEQNTKLSTKKKIGTCWEEKIQ